MKRKRFTEEQIIGILKEAEAGAKSIDLCRRHAISEQTFYRWKAKYAGLEVNEARRLRTRRTWPLDLSLSTPAARVAGAARPPPGAGRPAATVRLSPAPRAAPARRLWRESQAHLSAVHARRSHRS